MSNTPITEALIERVMAKHRGVSARAQADYYEAVHQELAPLCRQFEAEIARLKADMQAMWANRRADTGAEVEQIANLILGHSEGMRVSSPLEISNGFGDDVEHRFQISDGTERYGVVIILTRLKPGH